MLYRNQSDETLVMLTLAGEQRAYEALVVRYEKSVLAAAASVTRNGYMAEDAAQDAFVTAWMKLDMLREPGRFGAWVCRIAKNCAKNTVTRFRGFLSLDGPESYALEGDPEEDPSYQYAVSEEKELLHQSVGRLPEKVGQVIRMHYFEGLSIAEIADRMRVSEGTVKWQLHDGRKRLRKELCAMNESYNDTLVQRVMKKVEELKLWQLKNCKNGFETVYRDVLREVEELPESKDKYHALADVLVRGWWWLPGEKNDELFARIREAAEQGRNDDVMIFIVAREDEKLSGRSKIEFVRDKQIPRLEQSGFVKALGYEWFWLGYEYMTVKERENALAAFERVTQILPPSEVYHGYARAMAEVCERYFDTYRDKNDKRYRLQGTAVCLRRQDGELVRWISHYACKCLLLSEDISVDRVFANASLCDGRFTADVAVGESFVGSDGATLTFVDGNATVETPCGRFDGCSHWCVDTGKDVICHSYYKDGVGIVKQVQYCDSITVAERLLCAYHIEGGQGLLPMAKGNTWEYTGGFDPAFVVHGNKITVYYADGDTVILGGVHALERIAYDDNCWVDMIRQIRCDYCRKQNGRELICDVSHAIERAEALAVTPMEKAHSKAACSVARRILNTDPEFNPNCTETGHWNFFARNVVTNKGGKMLWEGNYLWSFEWKNDGGFGNAEKPILFNDVYGILQDAVNCVWSDEWCAGFHHLVEYTLWGTRLIKTDILCEAVDSVTTAAGTFEDCLKMTLDIGGQSGGWGYRGGKKEYYFACGIGIVRVVNLFNQGACRAVYELVAYEGMGDGYMPMEDGLMRRYEALDLTDGFVGAVEYTYVKGDDGRIVVFEDRTGIRKKPDRITQYSAILGEVIEEELWEQGKREQSRLRHDINNFNILLHFLGRPGRYWAAPKKAVAWGKYRMGVIEFLAEGGDIPRAWLGHYANSCFRVACALFGDGQKEEGYEYLDRAFALYENWLNIADGELLEVGNDMIYGGIKLVKGSGLIELPDGTRESIQDDSLFDYDGGEMYYGMTAKRGWEWFNSVRGDERFRDAVEKAKIMAKR